MSASVGIHQGVVGCPGVCVCIAGCMIYGVGTGRFGNAVAAASIVRFPAVSQVDKPVVVASIATGCCSVVIGKLLLFEVMIGGGGGGGGGRKHSNPTYTNEKYILNILDNNNNYYMWYM